MNNVRHISHLRSVQKSPPAKKQFSSPLEISKQEASSNLVRIVIFYQLNQTNKYNYRAKSTIPDLYFISMQNLFKFFKKEISINTSPKIYSGRNLGRRWKFSIQKKIDKIDAVKVLLHTYIHTYIFYYTKFYCS
jgi:hypothetical protein